MVEREVIKLGVTPATKEVIESVSRRYGMSQIEMASRLFQWFAEQDETVQTAILGLIPASIAPDVARILLERMAEEPEPDS